MKKATSVPPITSAVLCRDSAAVVAAIAAGARIDEVDGEGRTALHHAVIEKDEGLVRLLFAAQADVNARDSHSWTPLHFAASEHAVEMVNALLGLGALVDLEDDQGNTPLWRAVFQSRGRGQVIQALRSGGANPEHRNKHGISPRQLAETIANHDVMQWMR